MEAPLKKTVVHLAVVYIILFGLLTTTGQCSETVEKTVEKLDHNKTSEKTVAKRSVLHSYRSGLVSDFAYSLPATAVVPQYHVKQFLPAPAVAAAIPAPLPVVKPLVFPAYQQKIFPGNAFVTSHSVTFPRYPIVQRPIIYSAALPVAPPAPVLPPAPIFPAVRPFVPAPPPPVFPAPAFFNNGPIFAQAPAAAAPPPVAVPAPLPPLPAPHPPPPPPPPPAVVRPFIIIAKPPPLPPPPAPIFPTPVAAPAPVFPFAVAAPVPCHHPVPSNQIPTNVAAPSEPENFGFIPMMPTNHHPHQHNEKPWQQGGGGGSYLPPASAHLTYKPSQPLRVSIHSKYRPRWK